MTLRWKILKSKQIEYGNPLLMMKSHQENTRLV